jgi:heat shock protein HtpX
MSSGPIDAAPPLAPGLRAGSRIPADLWAEISSARRRSLLAACVQCLTVVCVGFIIGLGLAWLLGAALGQIVELVWGMSRTHLEALITLATGGVFALVYLPWLVYIMLRRHAIVLRQLRARDPNSAEESRLADILDEVAVAADIRPPGLGVIDDRAPNGFVVGSTDAPQIVVTTGLLALLERDELEAVVGHLVGRAVGGDLRYASLLAGNVAALGYVMQSPTLLPAALLCYLPATLETRLISRSRVFLADHVGVMLVRDPQALAAALEKIYRDPSETSGLPEDMAMLAFVDPHYPMTMTGPHDMRVRPWSDDKGSPLHPSLPERVERLHALLA